MDRLARRLAKVEDKIEFVKQVPQDQRDRLARRIAKLEDEVKVMKQIPAAEKVNKTQKRKLLYPKEREIACEKEVGTNNSLALLKIKNFDARLYLD